MLSACCWLFASLPLAADGIALSRDGVTWLAGAGAYGKGWGDVGKGITVEAGETLYIKYYSARGGEGALHYAAHGTRWGGWSATGPRVKGPVGQEPEQPIILKLANIGTPRSVVSWVNGSGTWSALTAPGVYDLALSDEARWTAPPITINGPGSAPRGWRALFGWSAPGEPGASGTTVAIPDAGGTAVLLVVALLSLGLVWWLRSRRSRPPQGGGS